MLAPEVERVLDKIQPRTRKRGKATIPVDEQFPHRLNRLRLQQGITTQHLATQTHVHEHTLRGWASGSNAPSFFRAPAIAAALGVPVAQLFTDELVLAEVRVSPETLQEIKREGREASKQAASRLAEMLEPLLWQEATRPPVVVYPGARAKPRRTREQLLAEQAQRLAWLKQQRKNKG